MQDNDGNTPLHLASSARWLDVVIELCKLINPEDFSIRNNQGQTAYDVARSKNFLEIAECINDMLDKLVQLNEDEEEEICLKNFRFLHDLFNQELDDRFFKKDYKPSRPLQLSSQQRDNESTEQLLLQSMHDAPQTFASSRLSTERLTKWRMIVICRTPQVISFVGNRKLTKCNL
jgi:ankyrin repeat protein